MKRVAICSYWFPPNRTIASLRASKFAKFLPMYGWEPVVVTVAPRTSRYMAAGPLNDDGGARVYRTPDPSLHAILDRIINRIGTDRIGTDRRRDDGVATRPRWHSLMTRAAQRLYQECICVPDETWPWLLHYADIRRDVQNADVDLIFSSAPPPTTHLLAARLGADLGKPWVADFRDPWSQSHTRSRSVVRRWVDRKMERRALTTVRAITTVSAPMAEDLQRFHDKPAYVIRNGFDEDDIKSFSAESLPNADRLVIVHTGMLYDGKRTPAPVFEAVQRLLARGAVAPSELVIRFYGRNLEVASHDLVTWPGARPVVELLGEVSYEESLRAQHEAGALLLLEWPDSRARGVVTGKLFEYLSANRPVIAVGPRGGEIDSILSATKRGTLGTSADELEAILVKMMEQFRRRGRLELPRDGVPIDQYSRRVLTGRLAQVFENVLAGEERQRCAG